MSLSYVIALSNVSGPPDSPHDQTQRTSVLTRTLLTIFFLLRASNKVVHKNLSTFFLFDYNFFYKLDKCRLMFNLCGNC